MNIIIVGAGTVGFGLAKHFSGQKHHITVIEKDKELCENINSRLDVFVAEGSGVNSEILETADIASADMIIAVTPSDETNLLVCNFAMQKGVEKRIARVRSNVYTSGTSDISLQKLGVTDVIEPERGVVDKILQYVEMPDVIESANFQSNNIYLRSCNITEDRPIADKTLIDIKYMAEDAVILFVVIVRDGENIPPTGGQKLMPGDRIVAIMHKDAFPVFRELINRKATKHKKVVIVGGTHTAVRLAEAIQPLCEQVILLDPDLDSGHRAASDLNGVEVFHGDSRDADVLEEINVEHADCFIAVGKNSEDNIMSCLLAKEEGAGMVIAVRDNDRYSNLFNSLGMDHIIYPQEITLNSIIEQIQTVFFRAYMKLDTADMEILRLKVKKSSPVTGKALQELEGLFKKAIVICCVMRGESVIIPCGATVIEEDDEVMVLCRMEQLNRISKLFDPGTGVRFGSVTTRNTGK